MVDIKNPKSEEDWLACIPLPQYVGVLTAGSIKPTWGETLYTDGEGDQMIRDQYMEKWVARGIPNADPIIILAAKERYLREHGPGVHTG